MSEAGIEIGMGMGMGWGLWLVNRYIYVNLLLSGVLCVFHAPYAHLSSFMQLRFATVTELRGLFSSVYLLLARLLVPPCLSFSCFFYVHVCLLFSLLPLFLPSPRFLYILSRTSPELKSTCYPVSPSTSSSLSPSPFGHQPSPIPSTHVRPSPTSPS